MMSFNNNKNEQQKESLHMIMLIIKGKTLTELENCFYLLILPPPTPIEITMSVCLSVCLSVVSDCPSPL